MLTCKILTPKFSTLSRNVGRHGRHHSVWGCLLSPQMTSIISNQGSKGGILSFPCPTRAQEILPSASGLLLAINSYPQRSFALLIATLGGLLGYSQLPSAALDYQQLRALSGLLDYQVLTATRYYELVQAYHPKFRQPRMPHATATRCHIFGIMLTAMTSGRG